MRPLPEFVPAIAAISDRTCRCSILSSAAVLPSLTQFQSTRSAPFISYAGAPPPLPGSKAFQQAFLPTERTNPFALPLAM
jgi:hypothetical protein